jgi:hypothetical protein
MNSVSNCYSYIYLVILYLRLESLAQHWLLVTINTVTSLKRERETRIPNLCSHKFRKCNHFRWFLLMTMVDPSGVEQLYRVILNYCQSFRTLQFANQTQPNKADCGMCMCNSKVVLSMKTLLQAAEQLQHTRFRGTLHSKQGYLFSMSRMAGCLLIQYSALMMIYPPCYV